MRDWELEVSTCRHQPGVVLLGCYSWREETPMFQSMFLAGSIGAGVAAEPVSGLRFFQLNRSADVCSGTHV